MATWNNDAFEKAAESIASTWHAGHNQRGASLNDLVEKTARDSGLNPEQIRRLARITNGFAFNAIFKTAGAEKAAERYPDFEVADADTVIGRLHQEAEALVSKTAAAYPSLDDQFAPHRNGANPLEDMEKRAAATEHLRGIQVALGPSATPYETFVRTKRAAEEAAVMRTRHHRVWEDGMAALRSKVAEVGFDLNGFEVAATSIHGAHVVPELNELRAARGLSALPLNQRVYEKLAEYEVHRENAATKLIAKTSAARAEYVTWKEVTERAENEARRAEDILHGRV